MVAGLDRARIQLRDREIARLSVEHHGVSETERIAFVDDLDIYCTDLRGESKAGRPKLTIELYMRNFSKIETIHH